MVCPLNSSGFQSGRHVGHQPVAHLGIVHVQGAGLGVQARLGPIDPDAESQAILVRRVGNKGQPMRKFLRVRVPVAHSAKPARIHVEHLQAQFL